MVCLRYIPLARLRLSAPRAASTDVVDGAITRHTPAAVLPRSRSLFKSNLLLFLPLVSFVSGLPYLSAHFIAVAGLRRRLFDDDLLRRAMGSGGEDEDATEMYLHSSCVDKEHDSGRSRLFNGRGAI